MLTKLNTIDKNLVPGISQISSFFFLMAKYSQRATNAYFIHKTISVRDKIAQIRTTQRKVMVTSYALLRMVRNCATTVQQYEILHVELP